MLTRAFRFSVGKPTTFAVAARPRVTVNQYSTLGEKAKKVGDKVEEVAQSVKEKFNQTKADATSKADELKEKAKDQAEKTNDELENLRKWVCLWKRVDNSQTSRL